MLVTILAALASVSSLVYVLDFIAAVAIVRSTAPELLSLGSKLDSESAQKGYSINNQLYHVYANKHKI